MVEVKGSCWRSQGQAEGQGVMLEVPVLSWRYSKVWPLAGIQRLKHEKTKPILQNLETHKTLQRRPEANGNQQRKAGSFR